MLYNACAIPIILFIGAVADLYGTDRVLYLLAACEIAFGLWSIYYERKHPSLEIEDETPGEQTKLESTKLPSEAGKHILTE
jgi:hypothetical protein